MSTTRRIARQISALSLPEIRVGIAETAHLLAQPLGVQPPALDVGREPHLSAERRHARELLRDRNLHVMPGNAFVIRDTLHVELRHRAHVDEMHVIRSGTRAVGCSLLVMLRGARQLAKRFDALDHEPALRPQAEVVGQARFDRRVEVARRLQIRLSAFVGVRKSKARIGANRHEELLQRARRSRPVA